MTPHFSFCLIAAFGALCQEALHWFELRNKLDTDEAKKMFTSVYYWLITTLVIVISGIGTMILFYEGPPASPVKDRIPFILGAAFPILFKKLVEASQKRDLGDGKIRNRPDFKSVVKSYFK